MLLRNSRRTIRRSTALALGGLVLAAPLLTSCGFDYATDRVYTAGNGPNAREASVDVLNANIVSAQDDSGTFVATFVNNNPTEPNTVESLLGAEGNTIQAKSFSPITIEPARHVNLAEDGGIPVTGTFSAGDYIPLTITLGSGERITMRALVVPETGQYAGLDISGSASEEPSVSPSEVEGSPSGDVEPAESPSASPTE